MGKATQVLAIATADDYEAAENWQFITTGYHKLDDDGIENFILRNCEFSKEIEQLKDDLDLTYSEIADILTKRAEP